MHHLLRFERPPARQDAGSLRRFVKRVYMRLLRPYAAHQRRIDLSIRDSVDELGADLVTLERRLASASEARAEQLREEISGLERRLRALDASFHEVSSAQSEELDEATNLLEAIEDRLAASVREQSEGRADLHEGVDSLAADVAKLDEALRTFAADTEQTLERDRTFVDALRAQLDRLAAGTEGTLGTLRTQAEGAGQSARADAAKPYMADDRFGPQADPTLGTVIGFDSGNGAGDGYRGFEDLFRGPEEMIRERQTVYVPLVEEYAPVLDAGCGRGEFLDLLRDAGIEARGVDLDPGMVSRCREKGHEVEHADLLEPARGDAARIARLHLQRPGRRAPRRRAAAAVHGPQRDATTQRRPSDRGDGEPALRRSAEGVLGRPDPPPPALPGDRARPLSARRVRLRPCVLPGRGRRMGDRPPDQRRVRDRGDAGG